MNVPLKYFYRYVRYAFLFSALLIRYVSLSMLCLHDACEYILERGGRKVFLSNAVRLDLCDSVMKNNFQNQQLHYPIINFSPWILMHVLRSSRTKLNWTIVLNTAVLNLKWEFPLRTVKLLFLSRVEITLPYCLLHYIALRAINTWNGLITSHVYGKNLKNLRWLLNSWVFFLPC